MTQSARREWARRWLLFCCGWLFVLGSLGLSQAQEARVTLGPSVMTFPEIAKKMSVGGRSIECAGALQYRAAFVSLKDRPWSQARSLLEAGLEVQFRLREENRWIMEWSAPVIQREQRWQRIVASFLKEQVNDWLAPKKTYLNTSFPARMRRQAELEQQILNIKNEFGALGDRLEQFPKERAQVEQRMQVLNRAIEEVTGELQQLVEVNNFGTWTLMQLLSRSSLDSLLLTIVRNGSLENTTWSNIPPYNYMEASSWIDINARTPFRYEFVFYLDELRLQYQASWRRAGFATESQRLAGIPTVRELQGSESFYVNAETGRRSRFATESQMLAGIPVLEATRSSENFVVNGGIGQDNNWVNTLFDRMGPEPSNWLQNEIKANLESLKDERFKKMFDVTLPGGATLSQVVEAWSRQTGNDAVIQLLPLRETLWSLRGGGIRLTGQMNLAGLLSGEGTPYKRNETLGEPVDALRSPLPWTFRFQNEALLVTNRWMFLERNHDYHLPAYRDLEKRCLTTAGGESALMPLDSVIDYSVALYTGNRHWGRYLYGDFRGLAIGDLGRIRIMLALINRMPNSQRIWDQLKRERTVQIPLARLSGTEVGLWWNALYQRLPGFRDADDPVYYLGLARLTNWNDFLTGNAVRHCVLTLSLQETAPASTRLPARYRLTMECRYGPMPLNIGAMTEAYQGVLDLNQVETLTLMSNSGLPAGETSVENIILAMPESAPVR